MTNQTYFAIDGSGIDKELERHNTALRLLEQSISKCGDDPENRAFLEAFLECKNDLLASKTRVVESIGKK